MKRVLPFLLLAATALTLAGCLREQAPVHNSPRISIRAYIPEEPLSKASFSVPVTGTGLHLAWQENDNIRVINAGNPATSEVFQIQPGFTDHVATFSGNEVAGDQFNIICPGSYETVAEAASGKTLSQTGNASTEHLFFTALLAGVKKADLPEITFSEEWASSHPGTTVKLGGIVKFVLTLPDELTQPTKVVLTAPNVNVSVNIQGVTLSTEHVLTAYAPCSWDDVDLPAGTELTVAVYEAGGAYYSVTKTLGADKTLKAGAQNILTIDGGFTEQLFAGGDGTQASPYLIATAKQLDNMHADGVLKNFERVYFKLIDDIDMSVITDWVPLNNVSSYDKIVNFNGNHHTISNFAPDFSDSKYNGKAKGMFSVLYGEMYDVTFNEANFTTSSEGPIGILAAYCGYSGNRVAKVYNVHIKKSKVTHNHASSAESTVSHSVGGLAGCMQNAFIESCSVDCAVWSKCRNVGGMIGCDSGNDGSGGGRIHNGFTTGSVYGNQRVGGIIGAILYENTEISNSFSKSSISATYRMGGIAGDSNKNSNSGFDTNAPNNLIQGCIAWNSSIISRASDASADHYSGGAIIGTAATHNNYVNCLRRSNSSDFFTDYSAYGLANLVYDQGNASTTTPLVLSSVGATYTHYYPYHGKLAVHSRLSQVARDELGWSAIAWNFDGEDPVLTGNLEPYPSSGASGVPAGSRGEGPKRPVQGGSWVTVTEVTPGITYYHYENASDSRYNTPYNSHNSWHSGGNTHQNVFVVEVDLNRTDYEVKLVRTKNSIRTSKYFKASGAYAAINCAYESGSIALKSNQYYYDDTGVLRDYPSGYPSSCMRNDIIEGTDVPNWKSQGTFYCDGHQGVQIAFDAYDPSKAPGGDNNPPIKSTQEMRLFYRMCTNSKPGFLSSSPMLIENYNPVGSKFHTSWYKGSWTDDAESPFVHQRSLYSRTAVALTEDNHLLLFVCDGKYPNNVGGSGMSASWVTDFLTYYFNPQWALNLDGGGSSTMCVLGQGEDPDTDVVNYPSNNYTGKSYIDKNDVSHPDNYKKNVYDHEGERGRNAFIVIVPKQ